jgi:multiple sugar transport system substrate-binding protein
MVQDAKLISSKLKGEGIYGFAMPMKNPASGFGRGFFQTLELSGYSVRDGYDLKAGKYDFTPYKPILEKYKEIFTSDAAFPACETLDIDPLRTQFANGKIGMYSTSNHSEWGVYTSQFPTKVDWAYEELPTIDGTIKGSEATTGGAWWTITADSKNPDKAWKVLEYLYSDELLAGYYEKGLGVVVVPSALKVAKQPESIQKVPGIAFNQYDKMWPVIPTGVAAEGDDCYTTFAKITFGQTRILTELWQTSAAFDKAVADGKTKKIQYPDFDPANPGKVFQK